MRKFTQLEWRIVKNRVFIIFYWLVIFILYISGFFFHIFVGICMSLWLVVVIFMLVKNQICFPSDGYFRKVYRQLTKEERVRISEQSRLDTTKFIRLGEIVFLEDFVLFTRCGVVLQYNQIVGFSHEGGFKTQGTVERFEKVVFVTNGSKKYYTTIWNNEDLFVDRFGEKCAFKQARAWIASHKG